MSQMGYSTQTEENVYTSLEDKKEMIPLPPRFGNPPDQISYDNFGSKFNNPPGQDYQGNPPGQGYQGNPPGQGYQGNPPGQGYQGYPPGQGYQGYPPGQGYQGDFGPTVQGYRGPVSHQPVMINPNLQMPYVNNYHAQPRINFDIAITLSCFVFWLFNFIFGGIAFILAIVGFVAQRPDNLERTNCLHRASYIVSIVGFLVAIFIWIVIITATYYPRHYYYYDPNYNYNGK